MATYQISNARLILIMHNDADPLHCEKCMMTTFCSQACKDNCHGTAELNIVSQSIHLKRRELLYAYHDDFKCIYAVQSGAIKTFHIDRNGQERIHQFYLPGEIIGLDGIHAGFYPYSAIALSATSVCELPFDRLMNQINQYPFLQKNMVSNMSHRINIGQYITAPSAEQRIAAFLLDIDSRLNHIHSVEAFELPMSRYDIGNYLSLAPETISRILTRFQQADLITVNHKKIGVTNRDRLHWIAQEGLS